MQKIRPLTKLTARTINQMKNPYLKKKNYKICFGRVKYFLEKKQIKNIRIIFVYYFSLIYNFFENKAFSKN
jgi:hypothetical protein